MSNAVLYTDGSASIREDKTFMCGFSFVIVQDGKPIYGEGLPGLGTINQAEMCGVYMGLKAAELYGFNITQIYTDSTYVSNGVRANVEKLKTGDWTNAHGSEVINKEMWAGLCTYWESLPTKPEIVHVKGHTGLPFNELCDTLAKEAAIAQNAVQCWFDPGVCAAHGLTPPMCQQPFPAPATMSDIVEGGALARALSQYTDDRAKVCYVDYPGMRAVISRCVAMWEYVPTTDELSSACFIHPVKVGDRELPLYKYRTEIGTPLEVALDNSEIHWQGQEFVRMLREAVANTRFNNKDLILASYNLCSSSARGIQGIYMSTRTPGSDTGEIVQAYRSERVEHGRYLSIPHSYLETLQNVLTDETVTCGLIHNEEDRYCLLVTGSMGGMLVSSAILPNTITCSGMQITIKGSSRAKVTFTSTEVPKAMAKQYTDRPLTDSVQMSGLFALPVSAPEQVVISTVPDISVPVIMEIPDVPPTVGSTEALAPAEDVPDMRAMIEEYHKLTDAIKDIEIRRTDLFNRIIDATVKYPVMTPHKVKEIEANVRAALQEKLNSLFI